MSDNTVDVKFGADTGALKGGLEGAAGGVDTAVGRMASAFADMASKINGSTTKITDSAKNMADGIKEPMGAAAGAVGKLGLAFTAITAVLAGGAIFKGAVDETVRFTEESRRLGRAMGITATEASAWVIALGDIYVSTDTMSNAAMMLTRQIRTNEQAIKDLGIKTRDTSGNLRPMTDIMMDAIKVMGSYKEGIDRNIIAMQLFGRGAADAAELVKLSSDRIEEAKQKQAALNMVVGEESVAAQMRYKAAMNDVGDVMQAFKVVVGNALLPVLSGLGEWFSDIGPAAVNVLKVAIESLVLVLYALKNGAVVVTEIVGAAMFSVAEPIRAVATALYKMATGDFKGAAAEMSGIAGQVAASWRNAAISIVDSSVAMDKAMTAMLTKTPIKAAGGGKTAAEKPDTGSKPQSRVGEWEQTLTDAKVFYQKNNDLRQMDKADELQYWQNIKNSGRLTKEETLSVSRKISAAELDIMKNESDLRIAKMRDSAEAQRFNLEARLELEQKLAAETARLYSYDSRQYEEAQKKIVATKRAMADQKKAIDDEERKRGVDLGLAGIDARERDAQLEVQLGQRTNAEILAMEVQFEIERNAIRMAAAQERKALALAMPDAERNPVEFAKLLTEIQALEVAHEEKMRALRTKSRIENDKWTKAFKDGLEGGMTGVLQNFLKGTMTVTSFVKGMAGAIADAFTNMLAKFVVNQIMNSALIKSIKIGEGTTVVAVNAAEAATGAAAAVAPTPFIGPALAAGAFATTMAMAMGAMSLFSARNGFDIPAGINPVTQLHENEMVLPAAQADVVRGLADNSQGAAAINFNVTALDGDSVKKFFSQHKSSIMKSIHESTRNGVQMNMKGWK